MKPAHKPASSRPKPCASFKKPHESCPLAAPCGPRRKKNDRGQRSAFPSETSRFALSILAHRGSALPWLVNDRAALRLRRIWSITTCTFRCISISQPYLKPLTKCARLFRLEALSIPLAKAIFYSKREAVLTSNKEGTYGGTTAIYRVQKLDVYKLRIVCVFMCVFFPFILDLKFVACTSRGHRGGRSHRRKVTQNFSSTFCCGVRFYFSREKASAVPFPRRP